VGEPLPIAPGQSRLWRSGLLAERLVDRGHRVVWWASTFEHKSKRHLFDATREVTLRDRLSLYLLHSPGYRRNVSLGRFWDHKVLARRFRSAAARQPRPDVIHCGFPTIELGYEATRYGRRHGVPVILDARDMWPDIFVDAMPRLVRPLAKAALAVEFAHTREAFRGAAAITGHAPGFVEFGLGRAGRSAAALDRDFPFAYPTTEPSESDLATARRFWQAHGVDMSERSPVFCFFGTFMVERALDLRTTVAAARRLQELGYRAQFVLCGDGPQLSACREAARDLPHVVLPGWVDRAATWTLLRRSTAGLMPYLPVADYVVSLPNKAVEYLSAGLPVVTSLLGGYAEQVLRRAECGVFYRGRDADELARALSGLLDDAPRLQRMRAQAAQCFEGSFTVERVCTAMAEHVEAVACASVRTGAVA
jgi:glycosyltransferase involved in cell wall biosynthesis